MPNEHAPIPSKGKLKHYSTQECDHCRLLTNEFRTYKDNAEQQNHDIIAILAEQKVMINRLLSQNAVIDNIMNVFPINAEEKLKELDNILLTQATIYVKHLKSLIKGNVEKHLNEVFGNYIIMNFNVDGTFGKKRLRDYGNVYAAIIEAISAYGEEPDKKLRAAFQRQKKRYFKQTSRDNKNKENAENEKSGQAKSQEQ